MVTGFRPEAIFIFTFLINQAVENSIYRYIEIQMSVSQDFVETVHVTFILSNGRSYCVYFYDIIMLLLWTSCKNVKQ